MPNHQPACTCQCLRLDRTLYMEQKHAKPPTPLKKIRVRHFSCASHHQPEMDNIIDH